MRLPHRNAIVTAVTGKAFSEGWDQAGTLGAASWTGSADAYVTDKSHNEYSGDGSSLIVTRTVVVSNDLPVAVGDTLTITWRDSTISPVVKGVVRREPPPGAGLSATTLLEIELT